MTPQEAIAYFGSQVALAKALDMKQPSIAEWVKQGVIPWPRQFQVQHVTGGALKADTVDPRLKESA